MSDVERHPAKPSMAAGSDWNALVAEIEAHDATKAELEAFKRDVSEAVKAHIVETERDCSSLWAGVTRGALSRFILPEPVDPLVEALRTHIDKRCDEGHAANLREALAKRGLTITERQP